AHSRIADLHVLRGDMKLAINNFKTAIDICEAANKTKDNQWDPNLSKATTMAKLATTFVRMVHPEAEETIATSKQLLRQFDITNSEVASWLLSLDVQSLVLERQRNPMDKGLILKRSRDIEIKHAAILKSDIASKRLLNDLNGFYFVMGRAYLEAQNPAMAANKFSVGRKFVDKLVELNPENLVDQSQRAVMIRSQGMAAGALGDLDKSETLISTALEQLQNIAQADQENSRAKLDVAATRSIYADALNRSGKYELAIGQLQLSIKEQLDYLELVNSIYTRSLLWETHNKLFQAQARLCFWPAAMETTKALQIYVDQFGKNQELGPYEKYIIPIFEVNHEALMMLLDNHSGNSSPTAELICAIMMAREAAIRSKSLKIPEEAVTKIIEIYPKFDKNTFPELYAWLLQRPNVEMFAKADVTFQELVALLYIYNNQVDVNQSADDAAELLMKSIRKAVLFNGPATINQLRSLPEFQNFSETNLFREYARQFKSKSN
ncbi:MAG: hypothetical protein AAGA30_07910, partial [Planctomycetota bacterium]